MNYRFEATEVFWASFYSLSGDQKESTRKAWALFKANPFDARLGVHKIHRLSAHYGKTIYAAAIESDLRVIFMVDGSRVVTLQVGTHDIYNS